MALLLCTVLCSALFMLGAALSPGGGLANRIIAWSLFAMLAPCSALFAGGLYKSMFATRIAERRWGRINEGLFEMGFREASAAEVRHTLGVPVQLLAPYTLAEQRGGGIDHVTVGRLGEQEIRAFNVRIRGGGWIDVPAVALNVPASFAPTVIRAGAVGIRPRPDMKRSNFEHERFNRSVGVYSTDPFFASALVDARMMAWLAEDLRGIVIELADRWVVVACIRRWRASEPSDLIKILVRFNEQIPRALPSLFPEASAHYAWRQKSFK